MDSPQRDSDDLSEVLRKLDESLRVAHDREPGTFTSQEYANASGVSRGEATDRIKGHMRAGLLEFVGKIPMPNICGGKQMTPVYRLKK